LGFVVVTHPFHPLSGQRLEVLFAKRRDEGLVFVCGGGVYGSITLPQAWTDRGEPPLAHRLSAEGLAAAGTLVRAMGGRWLWWLLTGQSCVMNDHKNDLGAMSTRRLLARRRALAERLGSVEEVLAGTLGPPVPLQNSAQRLWPAVWLDELVAPGSRLMALRLLYLIMIRVFGWLLLVGRWHAS
jgi:hypothetical protein